jgi:hypothetical protein
MRRESLANRGYRPSPNQLRKQLLPEGMERPKALEELNTAAAKAIDVYEKALADSVAAREAARAAPREDAAAAVAAHERGDETPAPTAGRKKELAEAAKVVVQHTLERADDALVELAAGIDAHRDELAEGVAETVNQRTGEALSALDAVETSFHGLAESAGHLARLHGYEQDSEFAGKREFVAGPLVAGGVKVLEEIAQLRRVAEELRTRATPYRKRILGFVDEGGEDGASWNEIAAKLGVHRLDSNACAVRNFLVEDGLLDWVDQNGRPLSGLHPSEPVWGRRLVRATPRETKIQRARRERRERAAERSRSPRPYCDVRSPA